MKVERTFQGLLFLEHCQMINIRWLLTIVFIHVNEETNPLDWNKKGDNVLADDVNVFSTVFECKNSLHHPTPIPCFFFSLSTVSFLRICDIYLYYFTPRPLNKTFSYRCFWSHKLPVRNRFMTTTECIETISINCLSIRKFSV